VNQDYINDATGTLTSDKELPSALLETSDPTSVFSPREWAMEHISPHVTTQLLEDQLRDLFGDGAPKELRVKVNSPEVTYFSPELPQDASEITSFVLRSFLKETPRTVDELRDMATSVGRWLEPGIAGRE
jgi:hypothetical protein